MVEEESKRAPIGGGEEIPVRLRGRFVPDESLLSTEIRRKLWDGQIALKIDLAVDDTISIDKPRSLYVSPPKHHISPPLHLDRSWHRAKTTFSIS